MTRVLSVNCKEYIASYCQPNELIIMSSISKDFQIFMEYRLGLDKEQIHQFLKVFYIYYEMFTINYQSPYCNYFPLFDKYKQDIFPTISTKTKVIALAFLINNFSFNRPKYYLPIDSQKTLLYHLHVLQQLMQPQKYKYYIEFANNIIMDNINKKDFLLLFTYVHKYKSNVLLDQYYDQCTVKSILQQTLLNKPLNYSTVQNTIVKIDTKDNAFISNNNNNTMIQIMKLNTESLKYLSINNNEYNSFPLCPNIEELSLENSDVLLQKEVPFLYSNIKRITLFIQQNNLENYTLFLAQMINLKKITLRTNEKIDFIQTFLEMLNNPKLQHIILLQEQFIKSNGLNIITLINNFPLLSKVSQSSSNLYNNEITKNKYGDSFLFVIKDDFLSDNNINVHTQTKFLENYLKKDYHNLLLAFKDNNTINEFVKRFMHSKIIMSRIKEINHTNSIYKSNKHIAFHYNDDIDKIKIFSPQKKPLINFMKEIKSLKNESSIIETDIEIDYIHKVNMLFDSIIYNKLKHATQVVIPLFMTDHMKKILIKLNPFIIILNNISFGSQKNIEWMKDIPNLKFLIYNHQLQKVKRNNIFIDM